MHFAGGFSRLDGVLGSRALGVVVSFRVRHRRLAYEKHRTGCGLRPLVQFEFVFLPLECITRKMRGRVDLFQLAISHLHQIYKIIVRFR